MGIPPGIKYLTQRAPQLFIGPILGYLLINASATYLDYQPTIINTAVLLLLSGPVLLMILLAYDDMKNYLAARSIGAVLPPYTMDPTPGGLGTIWSEIRSARTGYFADGIEKVAGYCGGYVFNLRLLFQNHMLTMEPEHIKTILATEFDHYEKGKEVCGTLKPLLGSGVFAVDGELWKFHRSMTRPFFTKDRISHFDNFESHADDAINQLKCRLREGHAVDIQDMTARFTLDSATEFLFGDDVRSLAAGIPYPHNSPLANSPAMNELDNASRFAKAFSEAQSIMLSRLRFGAHWPLTEFWHDRLEAPMKIVNSMIDPIVKDAVEKRKRLKGVDISAKAEEDLEEPELTLLAHLVNSTDDTTLLRDEIMSLLVAGRDTTANTLTFVIYMLALHPDVLRCLRAEILRKIGPVRRPTYEDIRDMKYLRAVINETLRLYPAVPFNLRMSKKAGIWSSNKLGEKPFYIPANTRIGYAVLGMHRRKDLWGPDALVFDPDRFLDDRLHKHLTPNPFIFMPFNAGPRICLGQQFAYNEASFFLVRLLQEFSGIALSTDAQPPHSRAPSGWANADGIKGKERVRPMVHLTLYLDGGLWVTMEEAKVGDNE